MATAFIGGGERSWVPFLNLWLALVIRRLAADREPRPA